MFNICCARTHQDVDNVIRLQAQVFRASEKGERFFRDLTWGSPNYRPEQHRIVEVDGKIVSHVQIFPRRIRIGSITVPIAGIGGVCTHPDYRRKGLATSLLKGSIKDMEEKDYLISLLFSDNHAFYRRLSWETCQNSYTINIHTSKALRASTGGFETRVFKPEKNFKDVMKAYDETYSLKTCTLVRSEKYWKWQLQHTIRTGQEDPNGFLVAEKGGEVVAYIRTKLSAGSTLVQEAAARRKYDGAYRALLGHMARNSLDRGAESIQIITPPDHPLSVFALELGGKLTIETGGTMARLILIPELFKTIKKELKRRLFQSRFKDYTGSLSIETDNANVCLKIRRGDIYVKANEKASIVLKTDQKTLTQMVMGFKNPSEAYKLGQATIKPSRAIGIVEALFPREYSYFPALDRF